MSCRDGPNDRVDLWRSLCTSLLYFVLRVKKVHVRYISSPDEFLVLYCLNAVSWSRKKGSSSPVATVKSSCCSSIRRFDLLWSDRPFEIWRPDLPDSKSGKVGRLNINP